MTQRMTGSDGRVSRETTLPADGRPDISRRGFLKGTSAAAGALIAGSALVAGHDASAQEGGQNESEQAVVLAGGRSGSSVEVDRGVRLHIQDWGAGEPIVLLHGWPSSHRIFERQMLALAGRGYRVIGVDLRGFGQSDTPWDGNDYDTWASDVGAVIKSLGLRDVTLAGYSMGGAIAVRYVATHRQSRVGKLALLGAAGPFMTYQDDNPHGMPPEMFDGMIEAIVANRAAFFHDFMPNLFHGAVSPEYVRWFEDIVTSGSLRATVRGLEEGRDRDLRADFASIDVPTMIVHGVHDLVVPFSFAEEQHRLIEGSTLVPFEDSGHALFMDEGDRLTEELAGFVG